MATQLFANNAKTVLASGISAVATSLTVTAGTGLLFPVITGSDYFLATLCQLSVTGEINFEIVKVTARTSDVFTIVRAQEGTTALVYVAGDKVELRLTKETMGRLRDFTQAGTGAVAQTVQDKLLEVISVKDFGATGDGTTNDNAAIQLALSSGATTVFFPPGTYNISGISVPSTVKTFYGVGDATKFVGIGSPTAYVPFITFSNVDGFEAHSFAVTISKVTYPTNHALAFNTCSNGRIHDIHIIDGGYIGINVGAGNNLDFDNIQIDSHEAWGFYAESASTRISVTGVKVLTPGLTHSIQINGGTHHKITHCYTNTSSPTTFGINYYNVADSIISNNICVTDEVEGINIEDCTRVTVSGNYIHCLSGHHDFGMSIYGAIGSGTSKCLIEGNNIYFPGKSGIAIASSPTVACRLNHVVGNLIMSPNQLAEAHGSGILLYGSALCSENTIQANRLLDEGSTMKYGVAEFNDGGSGAPQDNVIINNPIITAPGLVSAVNVIGTGSVAHDNFSHITSTGVGLIVRKMTSGEGDASSTLIGIRNSTSGTSKWLRTNSSGNFSILNNALSSEILSLTDAGNLIATGLVSGAGGIGHSVGYGGAVTQATSRVTAVTLNKRSGRITMFTAAGSATPLVFTVTNSLVAATDTVNVNVKSGATNYYVVSVLRVAAGEFEIMIYSASGTNTDTPVLNFNVISGAAS